jgi:inward rectifier potassium channel
MVNVKSNQLINLNIEVIFSRNEQTATGILRKYYPLELERSKVKFFPMSWTVVHPITKKSQLFGETPESLAASDTEILVAVEGTNDTYADPIHVRKSYMYSQLTWGVKFATMMSNNHKEYVIDLSKVSDYEPKELNV